MRNAHLPSHAGSSLVPAPHAVDMGPAWVWPRQQPKVRALLKELGAGTFEQPGDPGSERVLGGTAALAEKLVAKIAASSGGGDEGVPVGMRMGWAVASVQAAAEEEGGGGVVARLVSAEGRAVGARRHVVFCAPPRLLHAKVAFDPPLAPRRAAAMDRSRTWMVRRRAKSARKRAAARGACWLGADRNTAARINGAA